MPLEILHVAFVLFGSRTRSEGPEIATAAGLRVHLAGIKPVLAGRKLADHDEDSLVVAGKTVCAPARSLWERGAFEPIGPDGRPNAMSEMTREATDEVRKIVAEAAKLPLNDAAWALWRNMSRLDNLEGRPTEEQVRRFRAMTREQQGAYLKHEHECACEGPMFGYLKRAHPSASDTVVKKAIVEAVSFQDDCAKFLSWEGDFWECIVRAVAQAEAKHPGFLETTYRYARNYLAYLWK
jgi:hypothetical protein